MKNHNKQSKDWFSSPFPTNSNQFTIDRLMNYSNKQNELDQSFLFKNPIFAPNTPYSPLFSQSSQKNNSYQLFNIRGNQSQKSNKQQFNYQNLNHIGPKKAIEIDRKLDFGQQLCEDQSEKINFEQQLITPIKQEHDNLLEEIQKKQNYDQIDTTAKKSDFNESHSSKKGRPKEKGLRKLSQRAFQIVMSLKSVTYKDVATKLVDQLKQSNELQNQVADQQNVKRRVYDALNVLIAANVLKRDGRRIKIQKKQNDCSQQQKISYLQQLRNSLVLRKFRIRQKKKKRGETIKKFNLIKLLMKRNKQQHSNNKIIKFPFIGAFISQIKQDNMEFKTRNQFSVCLKESTIPFGDIDSVIYLQNSLTEK